MLQHRTKKPVVTIVLMIAFVMQLAWPSGRSAVTLAAPQRQAVQPEQTRSVYLPVVASAFTPPVFSITQPLNGWTVSGMLFFAVEPQNKALVQSVTFKAGTTTLGTDTTAADGYRFFFDASTFPAGTLQLTAIATGAGGSSTQSINVKVVPTPGASATVGQDGAVVATSIGSKLTIPAGGLPAGTNISAVERSQAEVTAKHKFEWERQGVTFLGAQDLTVSTNPSKPLGVASAGFGNRVQPGQAVVNYQLFPDGDGDGVSELVVVNGASVAPNNDVISTPISPVTVGTATTPLRAANTAAGSEPAAITGPPGTMIEIPTSGLNPYSMMGNIGVFRSTVGNTSLEVPVSVRQETRGEFNQVAVAFIPPLPVGAATLTIVSANNGNVSAPIEISVTQSPALTRPRKTIIDEGLAELRGTVTSLREFTNGPEWTGVTSALSNTLAKTDELSTWVADASVAPTPEQAQLLDTLAMYFQNSNIPTFAANLRALVPEQVSCARDQGTILGLLTALGGVGTWVTGVALLGLALGPTGIVLAGLIIVASLGFSVTAGAIAGSVITLLVCRPPAPPAVCPGTAPSLQSVIAPGTIAGSAHPDQTGGIITVGMGSAQITGGNGCGNAPTLPAAGPPLNGAEPAGFYDSQAGRVVVRILSGAGPIPFTGVTDAGGYFFVPLIPAGEPFTAVARDTLTGRTETITGVGPEIGESLSLNFDFLSPGEDETQPIAFGQVVEGTLGGSGDVDTYAFNGNDDDWVTIRMLDVDDTTFEPVFSLSGPDNQQICASFPNVPRLATNTCRLRNTGKQLIEVTDGEAADGGKYRLYVERLSTAANRTALSYGQVVAGSIAQPPAFAHYSINASTSDHVLVRVLGQSATRIETIDMHTAQGVTRCLASNNGGSVLIEIDCAGTQPSFASIATFGAAPGTFKIFTQSTVAPVNATALTYGQTVNGLIATAPAVGAYTFSAAAGDQVQVTMTEVDGSIEIPRLVLYRPDGFERCDQNSIINGSSVVMRCTLQDAGRYVLFAGDNRGTGTGRYTLKLERTGP